MSTDFKDIGRKVIVVDDTALIYFNDLDNALMEHMLCALDAQNRGDPGSGDAVDVAEYYFINHAPY